MHLFSPRFNKIDLLLHLSGPSFRIAFHCVAECLQTCINVVKIGQGFNQRGDIHICREVMKDTECFSPFKGQFGGLHDVEAPASGNEVIEPPVASLLVAEEMVPLACCDRPQNLEIVESGGVAKDFRHQVPRNLQNIFGKPGNIPEDAMVDALEQVIRSVCRFCCNQVGVIDMSRSDGIDTLNSSLNAEFGDDGSKIGKPFAHGANLEIVRL